MQFLKMRQKHYGTEVLVAADAIVSLEDAGGYTLINCTNDLQHQVVESVEQILTAMRVSDLVYATTVAS